MSSAMEPYTVASKIQLDIHFLFFEIFTFFFFLKSSSTV